MPGSPTTNARLPSPAAAASNAARSRCSSAVRPTNGGRKRKADIGSSAVQPAGRLGQIVLSPLVRDQHPGTSPGRASQRAMAERCHNASAATWLHSLLLALTPPGNIHPTVTILLPACTMVDGRHGHAGPD